MILLAMKFNLASQNTVSKYNKAYLSTQVLVVVLSGMNLYFFETEMYVTA